jgi:hypothetical protein
LATERNSEENTHSERERERDKERGHILGRNASLELAGCGRYYNQRHIRLRGTRDHILDKITVARGI